MKVRSYAWPLWGKKYILSFFECLLLLCDYWRSFNTHSWKWSDISVLWNRLSHKFPKSCLSALMCQMCQEQPCLSLSRHEIPKQRVTVWTFLPAVSKTDEGPKSLLNTENLPQDRGFLFPSWNSCPSCFHISLEGNSWFKHGAFLWAKTIVVREESNLGVQVRSHHTPSRAHAGVQTLLHSYKCYTLIWQSKIMCRRRSLNST